MLQTTRDPSHSQVDRGHVRPSARGLCSQSRSRTHRFGCATTAEAFSGRDDGEAVVRVGALKYCPSQAAGCSCAPVLLALSALHRLNSNAALSCAPSLSALPCTHAAFRSITDLTKCFQFLLGPVSYRIGASEAHPSSIFEPLVMLLSSGRRVLRTHISDIAQA